ncbi:MAG: type II toxin-antitoxin system RelE/ParE family toxin [Planctomycetes bacterium]|nr:type II toxin-antitoxin system RelE/ParE family toxin [Planctomycetota bacterium]
MNSGANMKYRVEITAPAESDIEEAYLWIRNNAPEAAVRWREGLYHVAQELETSPRRFGLAPEDAVVDFEVRQFVYTSYRILYTVKDDAVYILHVRRGARQFLTAEEIQAPP